MGGNRVAGGCRGGFISRMRRISHFRPFVGIPQFLTNILILWASNPFKCQVRDWPNAVTKESDVRRRKSGHEHCIISMPRTDVTVVSAPGPHRHLVHRYLGSNWGISPRLHGGRRWENQGNVKVNGVGTTASEWSQSLQRHASRCSFCHI